MKKILVLSGGSLVGYNIIEILAAYRDSIYLVTTNCLAEEPILYQFDRAYLVPETRHPEFKARIEAVIAQEEPDWIIAGRDDDVVFLAELAESHPELQACIWGQGAEAARIMDDKWLSYTFSEAAQLPFVPSTIDTRPESLQQFGETYGYPLLAKPRSGYASRGIYLCPDHETLLRVVQLDKYIVQEYIGSKSAFDALLESQSRLGLPIFYSLEEPKVSLQTHILADGSWGPIFATRHVIRQGMSFRVDLLEAPKYAELGEQVAHAFGDIGWRGPLNIQCKEAEERLLIMEFSGRVTGATAARYALGYHEFANFIPELRIPAQPNQAKTAIKKPVSFAAEIDQIARLKADGVWSVQ